MIAASDEALTRVGPGDAAERQRSLPVLLGGVLDPDPGEAAVTDALLDTLDLSVELGNLVEVLAGLLEASTASATRRAYEADWAHHTRWAAAHRLQPLPADPRTIALYLAAHEAELRPATLLRRLSTIAVRHRQAGYPSPTGHELVRRAVAGIRRRHGTRPAGKTALVTPQLAAIAERLHTRITDADQLSATLAEPAISTAAARRRLAAHVRTSTAAAVRARRDRALLLVGYAAALRRSELVGLDVGDLVETDGGLQVFIARSKTDQEGLGDFVGVAHGHPADTCSTSCPIRAWAEWRDTLTQLLERGGHQLHLDAPAFRPLTRHGSLGTPADPDPHARLTGQSVALVVKDAVRLLGEPARFPPGRYAGHSLRAGFATQAAAAGVPLDRIMRQTRHSSVAVALRYIRPGELWRDNPSAALGL